MRDIVGGKGVPALGAPTTSSARRPQLPSPGGELGGFRSSVTFSRDYDRGLVFFVIFALSDTVVESAGNEIRSMVSLPFWKRLPSKDIVSISYGRRLRP